jgi:hypothetical protein
MMDREKALQVIDKQLLALETIFKQAAEDLNTVRGHERVARWKTETIPLLAEHVGRAEAQRFAGTVPGPSFTGDLLEELSDAVEVYRNFLVALSTQVRQSQT